MQIDDDELRRTEQSDARRVDALHADPTADADPCVAEAEKFRNLGERLVI